MSRFWESAIDRSDGLYKSEDLEQAAYRLVSEQVLYHSDKSSRTAYGIVERYEREFRQALEPLGIHVEVNRQTRYAYALPRHARNSIATTAQTLLALVLRKIYDERARDGLLNDDGEVICELVDLGVQHKELIGRDLPSRGALHELFRTLKRWGIARTSDDEALLGADGVPDQPYAVVIRPAIVDILGETSLQRLAQWSEIAARKSDITLESEPPTPAGDDS